ALTFFGAGGKSATFRDGLGESNGTIVRQLSGPHERAVKVDELIVIQARNVHYVIAAHLDVVQRVVLLHFVIVDNDRFVHPEATHLDLPTVSRGGGAAGERHHL